jgi:hypothetical protein
MKSYGAFFVTAVMILGLAFLLTTRVRPEFKDVPQEVEEPVAVADAGVDASSDAAVVALADAALSMEASAPKPPAEKPIRVAALGWELIAAGVDATSPPMELAPEAALDAVEARLARGGNDSQGADIALVPLPAFVASYERLRALEPKVFLVVGFSRGREEVHANAGALAKPPPANDEVKVVALGPATAADANMRQAGSESATVLGLFALDLLGVAPTRVRFVAAGSEGAKTAPFSAVVRGAADERKLALSSSDASRFIPIVAIAPKGVLEARGKALEEWSKAWLDGLGRAGKDAPGVARRLAMKENVTLSAGVGGAPEALHLVERLGQVEAASLTQQGKWIGAAAAKGPVSIDSVMQRTWSLARAGGLTASAAPEPLPIDARIVSAIAPVLAPAPKEPSAEGDAGVAFGPIPAGSTPLLLYRAMPDGASDANAVAAQIAFLAGVFEHAVFKVSAKGGDKAAKSIASAARDKWELPPSRLATVAAEPPGAFAAVEILAPP